MMFTCPHCNTKSISILKKMKLEPRHKYKCDRCGGYINIPYYTLMPFGIISLIAIYIVLEVLHKEILHLMFILIPIAAMYEVIILLFVPIIKK